VQSGSPFPRFTGTAEVSVRPAAPEDAAEIARIQVLTWRTAYRELLPAAALDGLDERTTADSWRRAVHSPPTPGHSVLVALERSAVVGFAAYGPAELADGERPDPAGPTAEIVALLVEPRWGRRGHGSRLLAAVVDLAGGSGAARLQMWVPENDPVTARFLESAGWAPDGWARTLDTGQDEGDAPLRELRWHSLITEEDR
jgi:GNAT superfamily N-acetyltransferase